MVVKEEDIAVAVDESPKILGDVDWNFVDTVNRLTVPLFVVVGVTAELEVSVWPVVVKIELDVETVVVVEIWLCTAAELVLSLFTVVFPCSAEVDTLFDCEAIVIVGLLCRVVVGKSEVIDVSLDWFVVASSCPVVMVKDMGASVVTLILPSLVVGSIFVVVASVGNVSVTVVDITPSVDGVRGVLVAAVVSLSTMQEPSLGTPGLHIHLKPPMVLTHSEFSLQLSVFSLHSLMSERIYTLHHFKFG